MRRERLGRPFRGGTGPQPGSKPGRPGTGVGRKPPGRSAPGPGRALPAGDKDGAAPALRSTARRQARTWTVAAGLSAPAWPWTGVLPVAPRALRKNCLMAPKFVRPHPRGHLPAQSPEPVLKRSPPPKGTARWPGIPKPESLFNPQGRRGTVKRNPSGSFGREMIAGRPRSTWWAGVTRGSALTQRTPRFQLAQQFRG